MSGAMLNAFYTFCYLIRIPSHPDDVVSAVPILQKRKESERSSNLKKEAPKL